MSAPSDDDRLVPEGGVLGEVARFYRGERAPEEFRRALIVRLQDASGRRANARTRRQRFHWASASLTLAALSGVAVFLLALVSSTVWLVHGLAEPNRVPLRAEPASVVLPDEGECPDYPGVRDASVLRATTAPEVAAAGLETHIIEQATARCGSIQRRYLGFVPASLGPHSTVPVLLVLHGGPDKAEGMWSVQTHRRFDGLAARGRFIVIYANAVPAADSDPRMPRVPNEGHWQLAADSAVSDEDYLQLVVEDLVRRDVITGENDVFLVGHAEGANMALKAAAARPDFYAGVAAFMPYDLHAPPSLPAGSRLSKALFVLLDGVGFEGARGWARALGVSDSTIHKVFPLDKPGLVALPDKVQEGEGRPFDSAIALATRSSTVDRIDIGSPDRAGPRVRVFHIQHAGHFWPSPEPDDDERLIDAFGFRNQDIDGADETWRFLQPTPTPALGIDDDFVFDAEPIAAPQP